MIGRAADPSKDSRGEVRPNEDPPLDLAHLARQCQGDEALQAEVLQLFRREAEALVAAVGAATASEAAAAAHKLRGSALAIGAGGVARSAALVEERASSSAAAGLIPEAVAALRAHIDVTVEAIRRLSDS